MGHCERYCRELGDGPRTVLDYRSPSHISSSQSSPKVKPTHCSKFSIWAHLYVSNFYFPSHRTWSYRGEPHWVDMHASTTSLRHSAYKTIWLLGIYLIYAQTGVIILFYWAFGLHNSYKTISNNTVFHLSSGSMQIFPLLLLLFSSVSNLNNTQYTDKLYRGYFDSTVPSTNSLLGI